MTFGAEQIGKSYLRLKGVSASQGSVNYLSIAVKPVSTPPGGVNEV